MILCFLINLSRIKDVRAHLRGEDWDGWALCTQRYVERGTDISAEEQRAAFPLLSRWVEVARRGMPGKRWIHVNFELLVKDHRELRDVMAEE